MEHRTHHSHRHGKNCGHTAIQHGDHFDYLHDGHLHHTRESEIQEHTLAVTTANPDVCTGGHECEHPVAHVHGKGCGHEAVPHGDHVDYIVGNHLHHYHKSHCDHHGKILSS